MKKVLSFILAVVLVCSMATVAFASTDLTNTFVCKVCGGETTSAGAYNAHILEGLCGTCAYCKVGFSASDIADHQYICPEANIFCDYCGETKASEKDYADHIAACKSSHFYIPVGLIISHVKAYIGKIDFKKAFNDGKSFFTYVINIGKDVAGNVA